MKKISIVCIALVTLFTACKKETIVKNPVVPTDESELITTFKISFVETTNLNDTLTFYFRDIDGPGGNAPAQFDTLLLAANKTYKAQIWMLNESVSPSEDITHEIEEEATEHLICFTPTTSGISITRTDSDGTFEIGLQSLWTTTSAQSNQVKIALKHQPGIKNGSCSVGETDIELDFNVKVQ